MRDRAAYLNSLARSPSSPAKEESRGNPRSGVCWGGEAAPANPFIPISLPPDKGRGRSQVAVFYSVAMLGPSQGLGRAGGAFRPSRETLFPLVLDHLRKESKV
mgnify:CR=1 FL=1